MTHYNLVHFFCSHATSDENSSGQGIDEAQNNPSMATGESQEQEGAYSRSTKRQKESPLCYIDGHLSSRKRGVGTKITEVQDRVVLRKNL